MSDLLKSELEKIFGSSYSTEETELISYSSDASHLKGRAKAIVFPENENQIKKLIEFAGKFSFNLVPRGAGTGLCGGAVPSESIVIDMSRMDKIIEINNNERYAIVQPGVVLESLNNALKPHGLMFPIIPSSHKAATLGGMAATNAAGLRAVRFGRFEKWVLETKALDGKGFEKCFKGKNPFIGSEGIFGIITQLKLALAEEIKFSREESYSFDEIGKLVDKVMEIKKNPNILSIEFVNKKASEFLGMELKNYLITEYEEKGDSDPMSLDIAEKREGISIVIGGKGYSTTEDPLIPEEKMKPFLEWIEKKDIPAFGHIGYGIIHPRFLDSQKDLIKEMLEYVNNIDGKVSGEHGIGLLKKEFLKESDIGYFKENKKDYDPSNIMNPGKII